MSLTPGTHLPATETFATDGAGAAHEILIVLNWLEDVKRLAGGEVMAFAPGMRLGSCEITGAIGAGSLHSRAARARESRQRSG